MILLELAIGDLSTTSVFCVIDSKTSNNFATTSLASWPWSGGINFAQMPQVLLGYDVKPFTKAESYFIYARFLKEDASLQKIMSDVISFSEERGLRSTEGAHAMLFQCSWDTNNDIVGKRQPSERENRQAMVSPLVKEAIVATSLTVLVFTDTSTSHRKDGESLFSERITLEIKTKATTKLK